MAASQSASAVASAGVTREMTILGAEVLRGNFSRIPGSLTVMSRLLQQSGTEALNFGTIMKLTGSVLGTVFNPVILAFLGVSIGLDLLIRNWGKLGLGVQSTTEVLKAQNDELKKTVDGYTDATKVIDDYTAKTAQMPLSDVVGSLGDQFEKAKAGAKDLNSDLNNQLNIYGQIAEGIGDDGQASLQFFTDQVTGLQNSTISASDFINTMSQIKYDPTVGDMYKSWATDLSAAVQQAARLQDLQIALESAAAAAGHNQGTQVGLDSFLELKTDAKSAQIEIDALNAKSPAELADIARRKETLALAGQEMSDSLRQQKIDAAGAQAYAAAAHSMSEADKDRVRAMQSTVDAAKTQLDAVGKGVAATTEMTFVEQQLEAAETAAAKNHTSVSQEYIRTTQQMGAALGGLAQKTKETGTLSDLMFANSQLGRSATEQDVASNLRAIYGDDMQSEMDGFIAKQVRVNDALKDLDNIGSTAVSDFFQTLKSDFEKGTSVIASLGDAASKVLDDLATKLIDFGSQGLWDAIFPTVNGAAAGGGLFGWIASLFTGHADGTPSASPGLAWVGERGPELMKFSGGERVYDHQTSMAMAGGGGDTHNYYIDAKGGEIGVEAKIASALDSFQRSKGPSSNPYRRGSY